MESTVTNVVHASTSYHGNQLPTTRVQSVEVCMDSELSESELVMNNNKLYIYSVPCILVETSKVLTR